MTHHLCFLPTNSKNAARCGEPASKDKHSRRVFCVFFIPPHSGSLGDVLPVFFSSSVLSAWWRRLLDFRNLQSDSILFRDKLYYNCYCCSCLQYSLLCKLAADPIKHTQDILMSLWPQRHPGKELWFSWTQRDTIRLKRSLTSKLLKKNSLKDLCRLCCPGKKNLATRSKSVFIDRMGQDWQGVFLYDWPVTKPHPP